MSDPRPTRGERAYRLLLRLFPAAFRRRFGRDLLDVFRDKHRAAAERGALSIIAFWIRIVADALTSALGERVGERPRRRAGGVIMSGLLHDIRYTLRMTARRRTLSLVIIVTLALGIGANTAIFSLVNTVLLRPLPYRDPQRLFRVWERRLAQGDHAMPVGPANFFDWKARAASFEDVAWSRDTMYNLTGDGEPESVRGYRFSANMFSVLGVQPAIGRAFRPEEDRPGADRVVILSHKLWQRRYAGDPGVLGRVVTLNGEGYTVVGVMAAEFNHPQGTELWTPIALPPPIAARRDVRVLRLVARLKSDVSPEDAQAELESIYRDLERQYPDTNAGLSPRLARLGDPGDAKPMLAVLFGGVGFVLLIACANVANLLLADATSRRRELALRSALGATRFRVVRQMLTESVALALAGGTLGALVTWWTSDTLVGLFPTNISNLDLPLVERIHIGPGVFLFAFAISVGTGLLFGLLPAWNVTRIDLQDALKEGDRGGSGPRRTRAALVVAEVALSIVLLAGALLMVQSFVRLQQQRLGFDAERVLSARLLLPRYRYADPAKIALFTRSLMERLRAIPGVESAGVTNYLPLSGWWGSVEFRVQGQPEPPAGSEPTADYRLATEDYFRSMGIRLLAGRSFTARDDASAPRVAIVNETLAKRFWPGEHPVGRRMLVEEGNSRVPVEVVGLAADVKSFGLEEETHAELFLPYWQAPSPLLGIALRARVNPASLAPPVREAVWSIDRDQPITHLMPMAELARESLAFRRVGMSLAAGFGLLALALAAIGIYGVLSYSVTRRTREIGVRMALGATRRQVAGLIVREGLLITAVGIVIGLAAAVALTRLMATLLFGVDAGNPLTYLVVAAMLAAVALLASWIPARRATAVDPLVALRAE